MAIPNKGVLKEPSIEFLERNGLFLENGNGRNLYSNVVGEPNLKVFFLRTQDIPLYINAGSVDMGITGYDIFSESGLTLKELTDLKFGKCKLVLAAPKNKKAPIKYGVRVGTSFPRITSAYFTSLGVIPQIIKVSGAVEILPKLGVTDAVTDITSTGATLKENGLVVLDAILSSSARLFCKKKSPKVIKFLRRLQNDKNIRIGKDVFRRV